MNNRKPFLIRPAAKDYLWGGSRLNDDFNLGIDITPFAEAWVCSVHPDGESTTVEGENLSDVLKNHPEYLGSHAASVNNGEMPILIKLIDAKKFDAPIIRKPKTDPDECGTRITISKLKTGILSELSGKESEIRQRLELIYTPLLSNQDITITVRSKQLRPRNHCVWSESRYVRYNSQNVAARINIDRSLGSALFDMSRNCYLSHDEAEEYYAAMQEGEAFPTHIVEREKRLTGWLGIQRYADPNDFGIDFIRNGRKILISDKTFFQYENPLTLQKELQYPVELGTSIGGRIVGELHVDYLLPTYQKNDFDRADASWAQTVEAICGVGPFLP